MLDECAALPGKVDLFLETPDFNWILLGGAFEDIAYEHCSLFSPKSIQYLLNKHNFTLSYFSNTFGTQYMWVEAHRHDVHERQQCLTYKTQEAKTIAKWEKLLTDNSHQIYLWGAGGKGVAFLNTLDSDCRYISKVVDINPRKRGKFIPGTGHEIVSPDYLRDIKDDVVIIIMNENYTDEIKTMVKRIMPYHVEFFGAHGFVV